MSAIFSPSLELVHCARFRCSQDNPRRSWRKIAGVTTSTPAPSRGPTQGAILLRVSFSTGDLAADFSTHTRSRLSHNLAHQLSANLDRLPLKSFHNLAAPEKVYFRLTTAGSTIASAAVHVAVQTFSNNRLNRVSGQASSRLRDAHRA